MADTKEDQVKLALVYKLTKFVSWPEEHPTLQGDTFHLCVLGQNSFGGVLKHLDGRSIQSKTIQTSVHLRPLDTDACHLVFFNANTHASPVELERMAERGVLTLGDHEQFALKGGMIELGKRGKSRVFRINRQAALKTGIRFAAPLLELSTLVGE